MTFLIYIKSLPSAAAENRAKDATISHSICLQASRPLYRPRQLLRLSRNLPIRSVPPFMLLLLLILTYIHSMSNIKPKFMGTRQLQALSHSTRSSASSVHRPSRRHRFHILPLFCLEPSPHRPGRRDWTSLVSRNITGRGICCIGSTTRSSAFLFSTSCRRECRRCILFTRQTKAIKGGVL